VTLKSKIVISLSPFAASGQPTSRTSGDIVRSNRTPVGVVAALIRGYRANGGGNGPTVSDAADRDRSRNTENCFGALPEDRCVPLPDEPAVEAKINNDLY
jgi:hypothetical protein